MIHALVIVGVIVAVIVGMNLFGFFVVALLEHGSRAPEEYRDEGELGELIDFPSPSPKGGRDRSPGPGRPPRSPLGEGSEDHPESRDAWRPPSGGSAPRRANGGSR